MNKPREQKNAGYRSIEEFRRALLPRAYERRLQEQRTAEPAAFGTGLAPVLLESIKGQLAKKGH